jgi:tRNA A37 threonylcarbamoyladenosine synthetase subunit TsaC/SUA5/YrdC
MQGRLYRQQDILVNGSTATFSMADFMPGAYTIVLEDNTGKALHQQILIKH